MMPSVPVAAADHQQRYGNGHDSQGGGYVEHRCGTARLAELGCHRPEEGPDRRRPDDGTDLRPYEQSLKDAAIREPLVCAAYCDSGFPSHLLPP